jgi:hypothetical protein
MWDDEAKDSTYHGMIQGLKVLCPNVLKDVVGCRLHWIILGRWQGLASWLFVAQERVVDQGLDAAFAGHSSPVTPKHRAL